MHALRLPVQSNVRRKIKEEQTNLCIFWTLVNRRAADLTGFKQPVDMRCEWVDIGACPALVSDLESPS